MQRSIRTLPEPSLRVSVAETEEQMEDVRRLRYDVFGKELDYIKEGEEADPYDEIALNILAKRNGTLAGTVRILDDRYLELLDLRNGRIVYNGGPRFPMEEEKSLDTYRKDGRMIIELSRLAIDKNERRGEVYRDLMASCYHYVLENGITDGFILAGCEIGSRKEGKIPKDNSKDKRIKIPALFTILGFKPIGEPFYYKAFDGWGVPMHLSIEGVSERLKSMYDAAKREGILPDFKHRLYVVKNGNDINGSH